MAANKNIDWEKGEKLWRLGQLSAAEIGNQLGCSTSTVTRRMSKLGIQRDKTDEVRRRTREAIAMQRNNANVARNATQCNVFEVTEEDINEAVNANVALVMSHRKDLQRLSSIEQKLLDELEDNPTKLYLSSYQGEVIEKVCSLTVTEKSSALLAISNVQAKRIEKQRQAFNIDDDDKKDTEQVIVQLSSQDANL